jgi:hypothetical protein
MNTKFRKLDLFTISGKKVGRYFLFFSSSFVFFFFFFLLELHPVFEPRSPRCQGFETVEFLRGEDVSPTPSLNLED